ncbi:hypothetical protein OR1_03299 [Geobacter sp. OR-1]|nr:hypothetical protein OR1_03299 [Geobacter sp. OR-1]
MSLIRTSESWGLTRVISPTTGARRMMDAVETRTFRLLKEAKIAFPSASFIRNPSILALRVNGLIETRSMAAWRPVERLISSTAFPLTIPGRTKMMKSSSRAALQAMAISSLRRRDI